MLTLYSPDGKKAISYQPGDSQVSFSGDTEGVASSGKDSYGNTLYSVEALKAGGWTDIKPANFTGGSAPLPASASPAPSLSTQERVKQFNLETQQQRLVKAQADWARFGNIGLAMAGITPSSNNELGQFKTYLESKYNIKLSPATNVVTGVLGLPTGSKISQEDMWKWQKISTAASKAYFDAVGAKRLIDFYSGEKSQSDFLDSAPYGLPLTESQRVSLENARKNASWNNPDLVSGSEAWNKQTAEKVRYAFTEKDWLVLHPGDTQISWIAAHPGTNTWDYFLHINGVEGSVGATMADAQRRVNQILYPTVKNIPEPQPFKPGKSGTPIRLSQKSKKHKSRTTSTF